MSVTVSALVWTNGPTKAPDRLMLLALADNADDYGLAWPGMARLAEKCCVGENAARATVRRLESEGWIAVIRGGGTRDGIHGLPNRYQLDLERLRATPSSRGGSGVEATPQFSVTYPPVDNRPTPPPTGGEPSVEPPQEQPSLSLVMDPEAPKTDPLLDEFSQFWSRYPKKVDRPAALRAFKKARKSNPLEVIAAGLLAALPVWAAKDRQFIPNPATWLNGERWADELTPPDQPPVDENAWMRRRPPGFRG